MSTGESYTLSTSEARSRLSSVILTVQDPRSTVILTRHGKPVAAVVSMAELKRIWKQQDIEDIVSHGARPIRFRFGPWEWGAKTEHEAAERVQQIQMDRRMEREVLQGAGMEPVPGGELTAEAEVVAEEPVKRRGFWQRAVGWVKPTRLW